MINAIEEMTIFNAITGPDRRESYFPTRIYGISWHENSGVSGADGYKKSQDAYAIRIPYTAHIQDNRTFLPPEEYRRLPLEKIPKYWTIQEGDYIFPKLMYRKRWRWDDFSFRTGMIVPDGTTLKLAFITVRNGVGIRSAFATAELPQVQSVMLACI